MIVRVSVVLRTGLLVTVIDVSTNCAKVNISVKVKSVSLVRVGILGQLSRDLIGSLLVKLRCYWLRRL